MNDMLKFIGTFLGILISLLFPVVLIYSICALFIRFLGQDSTPLVICTVFFGIMGIIGAIANWAENGK